MADLDALIVGSPTQAFQPLKGVKVAAFDTRVDVGDVNSRVLSGFVKVFGYAAEPMGNQLVKKGGTQATPSAGFFVEGKEGPLREGEMEQPGAFNRILETFLA